MLELPPKRNKKSLGEPSPTRGQSGLALRQPQNGEQPQKLESNTKTGVQPQNWSTAPNLRSNPKLGSNPKTGEQPQNWGAALKLRSNLKTGVQPQNGEQPQSGEQPSNEEQPQTGEQLEHLLPSSPSGSAPIPAPAPAPHVLCRWLVC